MNGGLSQSARIMAHVEASNLDHLARQAVDAMNHARTASHTGREYASEEQDAADAVSRFWQAHAAETGISQDMMEALR